jgi:beta-lactamase regulating signal transducer with metallopeptidase domain
MLCILYVNVVGALVGAIGLLLEQVLPKRIPRRWVWVFLMPLSAFLPGYYRLHHAAPVSDWVGRVGSYDSMINPMWRTASLLLLMWGAANLLRVAYVVWSARRQRDNRTPTIVDGVPVVVTEAVGPATVGLLRSHVLVPKWVLAMPGVQRRYVLRHEEEHRSAHDARLLLLASLFIVLAPWDLAMWWQLRRLRLAVEMDCDNRVVGALGDANAYGELLFKVAQAASHGPRLQPALLGMGMLEHRLTKLLAPTQLRRVQRIMLAAVVGVLLFVVVSMPHPVPGQGPHAHAAMNQTAQR